MNDETPAKLRVGLLVNGANVPAWVHSIVQDIQEGDYADVVAVAEYVTPEYGPKRFHRKLWDNRSELVYQAYSSVDDRVFRQEVDAWEEKPLTSLLGDTPWLRVIPRQKKYSDWFPEDALEQLRALDIDVLLRFGFRILRGEVLALPRYGVWSYHHGDNRVNRGGPPGLWEVMQGEAVTGSVLQIITERLDDGQILYRSWSATDPRSVRKNRNNFYWKSSTFMPRKLKQLAREGRRAIETEEEPWQPYDHRLYVRPNNGEMIQGLATMGSRYVKDKLASALSIKQWAIRYHFKRGGGGPHPSLYQYKKITPPRDRYWADPFPALHDGSYYLFFEEVPYSTDRGHISVARIDRSGFVEAPSVALKTDYHLSYPFLIRHRGELFMIPETKERGTIELWRCKRFPNEWTLERLLFEGVQAVDTTLFEKDGRFWMFVNMQSVPGSNAMDELFLFHANRLDGDWKAHRQNPIVSDVRTARPAGWLFQGGAQLYRPAQDCSVRYGYGIAINRIDRLTPEEYRERTVSRIEPSWERRLLGVHTLNRVGELSVADVLTRRRRFGS